MKKLVCKAVPLSMSPVDVARQLSHLDGLVFFDSSGNLSKLDNNPVSIIAAEPVEVIRGEQVNFSEVRRATRSYKIEYNDVASDEVELIPAGGAFGWIDYDGSFCFGVYEACLIYVHKSKQWYEVGSILNRLKTSTEKVFNVQEFRSHTDKNAYIKGVEKIKGRRVLTKPIKGTRPRYDDRYRDEASARELLDSTKEMSELVMITDLERNDLGKVCEYGSVNVDAMLQLEKLEHVYHLVSTISGILRDDVDHWQAVSECFPGGSITGAPKKRAMEIIQELEGEKRGLYTGAIGYIGFNDISQFNIVIRTLVKEGETLHYHVGAGIVADSDPVAEYEETLHKAKGIRRALAQNMNRSK